MVAPPDAVANCTDELTRAGVTFLVAELPLKRNEGGAFTCGAFDAVVYQKGPSGLSISPPALMTCRMALDECAGSFRRVRPRLEDFVGANRDG